jgi:hypothetical protein
LFFQVTIGDTAGFFKAMVREMVVLQVNYQSVDYSQTKKISKKIGQYF